MRDSNVGKLELLRKKIVGIIVAIGLILGSLTVVVPITQAQDHRRDDRYEQRDPRHHARFEYERGFRDGRDRGREDARERRRFDPENSSHFREGSRPYREGFMRGYREAYREHMRHDRHDRYDNRRF